MPAKVEVVIVGAGPTGLMLGCWLARAGVRALILDAKAGPANESRAVGVQARTMETYDMMGLGAIARAQGVAARGAAVWVRRRRVAQAILADMGRGLSPHPYLFVMGQDRTERMLLEDLQAHGGDVAYGTTFVGLKQTAEAVTAEYRRADGTLETVEARYLCGCDGASSPVRHALGIGFGGGTYPQRFYVADVVATGPLGHGELGLCADTAGFIAFFPMLGPHHYRIIGIVPPERVHDPDLDFDCLRANVEARSGMAVPEALWFSTYNVHHRVADRFRQGRVFLLGDAGHIHSPVGGQGMNTGLMDAANLGWKLGAVVRGWAGARILDSYEPERMPFARSLVATTDRVFSLVSSPRPWVGALRASALTIMFSLATHLPGLRRALFGLISQTRVKYGGSPLSAGQAGNVKGGDRLPWVPGGSNYEALAILRPHLQVYGPVPGSVEAFAAAHPGLPLVRLPGGPAVLEAGLETGAVYFVRPDGYVAYAATGFEPEAFLAYLGSAWDTRPSDWTLKEPGSVYVPD